MARRLGFQVGAAQQWRPQGDHSRLRAFCLFADIAGVAVPATVMAPNQAKLHGALHQSGASMQSLCYQCSRLLHTRCSTNQILHHSCYAFGVELCVLCTSVLWITLLSKLRRAVCCCCCCCCCSCSSALTPGEGDCSHGEGQAVQLVISRRLAAHCQGIGSTARACQTNSSAFCAGSCLPAELRASTNCAFSNSTQQHH